MLKMFKNLRRSPHQDDIDEFHATHAKLEEIGRRLSHSGHHIHIEYPNKKHFKMAHSSDGGPGGTHFFDISIGAQKKIHISRSPTRNTGHKDD